MKRNFLYPKYQLVAPYSYVHITNLLNTFNYREERAAEESHTSIARTWNFLFVEKHDKSQMSLIEDSWAFLKRTTRQAGFMTLLSLRLLQT